VAVLERGILSNPIDNRGGALRVSSSAQENFHRQLNRCIGFSKASPDYMHMFLMHLMFRWNVGRRRAASLEHDWVTFDLQLVHEAFHWTKVVQKHEMAMQLWGKPWLLPDQPTAVEEFGLYHPNVTLDQRLTAATSILPISSVTAALG
jgi:hypothetical protein